MNTLLLAVSLALGANQLTYELPLHPTLVHLTLGLFIIAIIFDLAGNLFSLERPLLKAFAVTALRSGFYDVGWYNLLAAAVITVFTVAAGFFEIMLAVAPAMQLSAWGLSASTTMLHGLAVVGWDSRRLVGCPVKRPQKRSRLITCLTFWCRSARLCLWG